MRRTGIIVNFSITVALGFIVGCAIAGQTFYTFVLENLAQFGSLEAMGVSNRFVRHFSVHHINSAEEGGLTLAGLGQAGISD